MKYPFLLLKFTPRTINDKVASKTFFLKQKNTGIDFLLQKVVLNLNTHVIKANNLFEFTL